MTINSAKLIIEFLDPETGELTTQEATLGDFKEATKKATTRTRKVKSDDEPIPMVHLLSNKLQFNTKAIELTGFEVENKILINFEKKGRKVTPVMYLNDQGNRMTKTFTVSYRGSQHDNLLQYGENFEILPTEKDGYFKLKGNVEEIEDDIIDIPVQQNEEENIIDTDNLDNFDFDLEDA